MINLEKALVKDAKELLKIQKQCFKNYSIKYGDFDSNPYHMTLHRMEFNLKYKFGHYYKIVDFASEQIIGGIFIFELDDPSVMQIAQFYIIDEFRHLGIGRLVFDAVLTKHCNVKTWYVDTILEEDHNVNFYKKAGFIEVEREEEHKGLSFVTLIKKR
jgi:GNAT superfamily N-acetyltransferase